MIANLDMLHKCWYPVCVGQAAAMWVLSPLGSNLLLSMLTKGEKDKYVKISKILQTKESCSVKTSLFLSPDFNEANKFKTVAFKDVSRAKVDFGKEGAHSINQWVIQHGALQFSIENKNIPSNTKYALVNLLTFKCQWKPPNSSGRSMKVYNSFKYTQDINYEARIMELPMRDEDFRMVILVPNEADLLNTLFRRLTNEGLAASFASVQPLFSVDSMFRPPNISIKSETAVSLEKESQGELQKESLIQYGAIEIDSDSVRANVLSCLLSSESKAGLSINNHRVQREEKPFFFAITFNDIPIFIGQYIPTE